MRSKHLGQCRRFWIAVDAEGNAYLGVRFPNYYS
jgi:hypothetical protein